MKKLFTLLFITLVLGASGFGQTVHEYTAEEMDALIHELRGNIATSIVDGDIIEFTTAGGIYAIDSLTLNITKSLIFRAAASLDEMPIIKRIPCDQDQDPTTEDDGTNTLIKLIGDVDVVIDGIGMAGDGENVKYAIKTMKCEDDFDIADNNGVGDDGGYEDWVLEFTDPVETTPLQNYNLTIMNSKMVDIKEGSSGSAFYAYAGMSADLIKFEKVTFANMPREAIFLGCNGDERSANPWNFTDSLVVINCTFANIRREAIHTRAENSAQDSMNITYINHCTFDSCGVGGTSDSDRVIALEYNKATILNSIISNDVGEDYAHRLREESSFIDYMGYWKIASPDSVKTTEDIMEGSNKYGEDPAVELYVDAMNDDYTLATTTFVGMASDGEVLGDMRNAPGYVHDNNAYLSGITVGDTEVADFDHLTYDYSFEVPFGTTEVPTVVGTAINGSTPEVTYSAGVPGTTEILVTANDGITTRMYEIFIFPGDEVINGLNDAASDKLAIYPNPSDGSFTILNSEGAALTIYSVSGNAVYQAINISANELVTTNLNKGVYYVSVQSDNLQQTKKMVIE